MSQENLEVLRARRRSLSHRLHAEAVALTPAIILSSSDGVEARRGLGLTS